VRKILGILATLIAVLCVSWLSLHRKNESESVSVAPPENPAPLQQAGSTFTYNFDSDSVGLLPKKFHSARTGQGPSSQWVVLAESDEERLAREFPLYDALYEFVRHQPN
jgi:hypothetical protein